MTDINDIVQSLNAERDSPLVKETVVVRSGSSSCIVRQPNTVTIVSTLSDWLSLVAIVAVLFVSGTEGQSFTTLDLPGARDSRATGINNSNEILGVGDSNLFIFSGNKFHTLTLPSNYQDAVAFGINDGGQLVGMYVDSTDGLSHGFISTGGVFDTVDFPPVPICPVCGTQFTNTQAMGINSLGQIVGNYTVGFISPFHGFSFLAGNFNSFDFPDAGNAFPTGINNLGHIVGSYTAGDGSDHGFVFDGTSFTTVDFPGGFNTTLAGINNLDQIVGTYTDNGTHSLCGHGFVLTKGDFKKFDIQGAKATCVAGINDSGVITGFYLDGVHLHGFLGVGGCQVSSCGGNITDNCVSVSTRVPGLQSLQYMVAMFVPPKSTTLSDYANSCGFTNFNWQQTVITNPCPGPIARNPAAVIPPDFCLNAPIGSLAAPFADPPKGGLNYFPPGYDPYPFYYLQSSINPANGLSCTLGTACPPFPLVVDPTDSILSMVDGPANPNFPGIPPSQNPPVGTFIEFFSALVGVDAQKIPTTLYSWTWNSTFNGTAGGVSQTSSVFPIDPGTGAGGITITGLNGVPQKAPTVTCTRTPDMLWPPNNKPVLVSVLGSVAPGTQPVAPSDISFSVSDSEGKIEPHGPVTLRTDGSYSFTVPLIASRDGNETNGRVYTVTVNALDAIGNLGSCASIVRVPHDQSR